MKERDQSGGQNIGHEVSKISNEKHVPLQTPEEPSHTESQSYIKEQEGPQAIEIERRLNSFRLPELKQLPTDEWVNQINTLYPDVVTPQEIRQDLLTLDQIGNNAVRKSKWNTVRVGGFVSTIGSFTTALIPGSPIVTLILVGMGASIVGAVGIIKSDLARRTINQLASQWNNRGENWLH